MAARKWTKEQRVLQAQRIRDWKPWEASTGPKSIEGKQAVRMNAQFTRYQDLDEYLIALSDKIKNGGPRLRFTGYSLLDAEGQKRFRKGIKQRHLKLTPSFWRMHHAQAPPAKIHARPRPQRAPKEKPTQQPSAKPTEKVNGVSINQMAANIAPFYSKEGHKEILHMVRECYPKEANQIMAALAQKQTVPSKGEVNHIVANIYKTHGHQSTKDIEDFINILYPERASYIIPAMHKKLKDAGPSKPEHLPS